MTDIVILGFGPAAISCAIYLKRFGMEPVVVGKKSSALSKAHLIENYYGIESITGSDLFESGIDQLKHLNISYYDEEVLEISYFNDFNIVTTNRTIEAKKVVLATGKARNSLNIEGCKEFDMKGISYCAVCDGFFYKKKRIGVVGSGAYMEHELDFLKNMTKDIIIFTNGEDYSNDEFEVVKDPLVKFYGDTKFSGVQTTGAKYDLDGCFIALGSASSFSFVRHLGIAVDSNSNIVVNENYETNIHNLFAIGDAIGGIMQVTKASYDGMKLAYILKESVKNV